MSNIQSGGPNHWQILYMFAETDLSLSKQHGRRLIQLTVPPIQLTGYSSFAAQFLILSSFIFHLSHQSPFTSFHSMSICLLLVCLFSITFLYICSTPPLPYPASCFSPANHLRAIIMVMPTNRSPFKWLLTSISINCFCSIRKCLSWHAKIWRVQMQKPLSAIWNFLLEWSFLSSLYI